MGITLPQLAWSPRLALLGLALAAGLLAGRGCGRATERALQIAQQNVTAALDSTRLVATRQRDSMRVYARLLQQGRVELAGVRAEAARREKLTPVLDAGVTVRSPVSRVDTVHVGVVAGEVGGSSGVRLRDSLHLAGPPVEGDVAVAVDGTSVHWSSRLRPSPVEIGVSVGCGPSGPELLAEPLPGWEATISRGTVDPRVCHPPSSKFWPGVKTGVVVTSVLLAAIKLLHVF